MRRAVSEWKRWFSALYKIFGTACIRCGIGRECTKLNEEGMLVYKTLEECTEKFDIITSFHVLEHLADPIGYLMDIKKHLKDDGEIILETPNADNALLSLYNIKEFADFTYWSPHIILYNYDTIRILAEKSGLKVKWNRQVQRYPLANHLYWLSVHEPGG